MDRYLVVFLISVLAVGFFYLLALLSNGENRPIIALTRSLYHISVVIAFGALGYFFSSVIGFGEIILSTGFMIPGLFICLGKIMVVPADEIVVIQNNLFTQKLANGDSMRLFARSGIIPLLHGEVTRESWKQETREVSIKVSNMETAFNSTPVDVSLIFWITPDFNNVQAFLTTDHSQATWWTKVTQSAKGVVTARVSDLIKRTAVDVAITDKAAMSCKLFQDPFDSKFEEELDLGFKIKGLKFVDIDLTSDVRSANEQILKSSAYGKAAKSMLDSLGVTQADLNDMGSEERTKVLDIALARVLASAGKIKVNVIDLKTAGNSGSGNGLDMATATVVKAAMENNNKEK